MKFFWTLLFFFSGMQLGATTLTEGFTTLTQKGTSAAVWNIATGFVHPTLIIKDYQVLLASPLATAAVEVSDGSHGIFNSGTYASFGTVVGSTITINALAFPVLKFTSFHLENGYTLTSINGPLIIHSLSDVLIDGIILCSGVNGNPAVLGVGGGGGTSRCGGQSGGAGGNLASSGTGGLPLAGAVTGGGGATYNGVEPGAGGGGGGAYVDNSGAGGDNSLPAAVNTRGLGGLGAPGVNPLLSILAGSPGGGGGSGSNTEGGGGGGGGGGTVIINAVGNITISATGIINAFGGNGGGANTGGGGGGGGGGSVILFAAGNLHLDAGTRVDASEGTGAIPTLANAGNGGNGSYGLTWDAWSSTSGAGSITPGSGLIGLGSLEYSLAAEITVSKSFDTLSALSTYSSVTTNPVHPDIVLQIAGSSDNFTADDTGWLNSNQVVNIANKRYLKFRIILTNSNALVPTKINDVSITFDPGIVTPQLTNSLMLENFEFKSGCGSISATPPSMPPPTVLLLLLFVLLLPVAIAGRLKLIKSQK